MSNAYGAGAPGPGGDQGGFLSFLAGLPAATQAAIMRTMNYANPIQPAAADTLSQSPNPLNNPSSVPPALVSGGPPVPRGVGATGPPQPPMSAFQTTAPPTQNGLPTNFGGGAFGQGGPPPQTMPYAGGQGPILGPQARDPLTPTAPNNIMGWPAPIVNGRQTGVAWISDPRLDPPTGASPGMKIASAPRPKARIPPTARAQVPAAAAKSPFTLVDAPNANPGISGGMQGGALAQGGPSTRGQITALDLSKLFGRG